MFRPLITHLVLIIVTAPMLASQSKNGFDLARSLILLKSKAADVRQRLSSDTFDIWQSPGQQVFFRRSENIYTYYSTARCVGAREGYDSDFILPDIWKVDEGLLVLVRFEPKRELSLTALGLDLSTFKKERLFRSQPLYFVYFDKSAGVAIRSWGNSVESVDLFPGAANRELLCEGSKIANFFSKGRWRLAKEHKENSVDFNHPGNVADIKIEPSTMNPRIVTITVVAKDAENDVLTYLFRTSAGEIISKGNVATWDLTTMPAGAYEIKVAVDDGLGPRGAWLSKWIEIK